MKLTEYLVFAALLTPTLVVVAAAVVSLAGPEAAPEYHPPISLASSAGLYPADMTTDE
jgi:Spy/CpxP family protein refolding chaperone